MGDPGEEPRDAEAAKTQVVTVPPGNVVGYRKPPVEHRFQKGASGNPRGRPRQAQASRQKKSVPFGSEPANQLLIAEAYRPVAVREGDKVIELPAIQAVFRSMGVSAMKGNRFAQKMIADLVRGVEEEDRKLAAAHLDTAMDYKIGWTREIKRCRNQGLPVPTPVPHPDDIIVDLRTNAVRIAGPRTEEEKREWDECLAHRAEAQEQVNLCAQDFRRSRKPRMKEILLSDWHHEQLLFDIINDNMPERYKAKLENRLYREGASRPGQASAIMAERRRSGKS